MTIFANCQNDHLRVWWPRSQAFSVLGCADSHLFSELAKHLDSETRGVAWMVSCLRHLTWDVDPVLLWFFVSSKYFWKVGDSKKERSERWSWQFGNSGSQRFATFKSTFSCGVSMGFGLRARGGVMDWHLFTRAPKLKGFCWIDSRYCYRWFSLCIQRKCVTSKWFKVTICQSRSFGC